MRLQTRPLPLPRRDHPSKTFELQPLHSRCRQRTQSSTILAICKAFASRNRAFPVSPQPPPFAAYSLSCFLPDILRTRLETAPFHWPAVWRGTSPRPSPALRARPALPHPGTRHPLPRTSFRSADRLQQCQREHRLRHLGAETPKEESFASNCAHPALAAYCVAAEI